MCVNDVSTAGGYAVEHRAHLKHGTVDRTRDGHHHEHDGQGELVVAPSSADSTHAAQTAH